MQHCQRHYRPHASRNGILPHCCTAPVQLHRLNHTEMPVSSQTHHSYQSTALTLYLIQFYHTEYCCGPKWKQRWSLSPAAHWLQFRPHLGNTGLFSHMLFHLKFSKLPAVYHLYRRLCALRIFPTMHDNQSGPWTMSYQKTAHTLPESFRVPQA